MIEEFTDRHGGGGEVLAAEQPVGARFGKGLGEQGPATVAAAFEVVLGQGFDTTSYLSNPRDVSFYAAYQHQMRGEAVDLKWASVDTGKLVDDSDRGLV